MRLTYCERPLLEWVVNLSVIFDGVLSSKRGIKKRSEFLRDAWFGSGGLTGVNLPVL